MMVMQGVHEDACTHGNPVSTGQYRGQGTYLNQGTHSKDWEDGYAAGYSACLAAMRQQGPHHQWQGQLGVAQVNGQN